MDIAQRLSILKTEILVELGNIEVIGDFKQEFQHFGAEDVLPNKRENTETAKEV